MVNLIDIQDLRVKEFEKLSKRKKDLELLVHVCTITYNSIIQIDDIDRFCFSSLLNRYLNKWQNELNRINLKLGIK